MIYDAFVIGGGVCGASIARYLSLYDMKVALAEKNSELCTGASKANSGIAHAGHDPMPSTLKARFNVRGSALLKELRESLDIDYINNSSLVISFDEDPTRIQSLYDRGVANGVPDMEILTRDEILEREPNINPEVTFALLLKTGSIVCPFSLTYAMAENGAANGVEIMTGTEVTGIERLEGLFRIETERGEYLSKTIVNAAGIYSDRINNMVSPDKITVKPKRGEYLLLDKSERGIVHSTVFRLPTKAGKGVLVTPTVHGNILIGPNNESIGDKENTSTSDDGLSSVMESAKQSIPGINLKAVITSFAGLRSSPEGTDDFILNEPVPGFFNCAGIESPGLTSAPAIGEYLSERIAASLGAEKKKNPVLRRAGIPKASSMKIDERNELIKRDSSYGKIVCRCEEISEGEIIEAIRRGAVSLDGIKRRVRAGMGRCQGGFCTPSLMKILSEETGMAPDDIRKNEIGSEVIL